MASPVVTTQHLVAEIVVLVGLEPQACTFQSDPIHDAFSVTCCKNKTLLGFLGFATD
jgi:hypothetical protein